VLVVALSQERRALQPLLRSPRRTRLEDFPLFLGEVAGRPVLLLQSGIGPDRARRGLLGASRQFPLQAAWSLGFAGGLGDALRPGDLVCPGMVLRDDGGAGRGFAVPPARASVIAALSALGLPLAAGSLLSVDFPLRTPEAKRTAHRRTAALAVDMEAAAVAEAAEGLAIPWLAIKAIVDPVEESLPDFLAGCTTPRGDLRWSGVLLSLGIGSRRRALRRLGRASRLASLTLRRGLGVALDAGSP
jgi:nucleoside phosphorylase